MLRLGVGEDFTTAMVSDGIHAYVGLDTTPAQIVKVRLSDRTRVGVLILQVGDGQIGSAVTDGTHGYFGTQSSPAKVIKIRLADLARVDTKTMAAGVEGFVSAVSDGTHGYFVSNSAPSRLTKVRFSDLSSVTATFRAGEDRAFAATINGVFGYFGTLTSPGKVVKMNLAAMTHVTTLTLNAGENDLRAAFNDGYYAYFASGTSPGRVIKVWIGSLDVNDLDRVGAVTLSSGLNFLISAEGGGGFGYFGTYLSSPSRVVKVQLSNMQEVGSVSMGTADAGVRVVSGAGRAWFGTFTRPANLVEIETVPRGVTSCGFSDESQTPSWAREAVCWVGQAGVTESNPFKPRSPVTRAQMAAFLWRLAGKPPAPPTCAFTDAASIPTWAANATCWAKATGVTDVARFRPTDTVSREEMATFLWRLAGKPTVDPTCTYQDSASVAAYARGPVCWLRARGLTTENPFNPKGVVSRAQMATFLERVDRI